jgi:hypothetical protein
MKRGNWLLLNAAERARRMKRKCLLLQIDDSAMLLQIDDSAMLLPWNYA